jgi:CHAT domain-containing protein
MNEQFTEKALEEGLKSQDVVHIASHFVLRPGNDDLSFLLLGGKDQDHSGYKYSMADFEKSRDVQIQGTKLLTLSACQTGAANERDICFQNDQSSVKTAECQAGNAKQRENGVVMESMSEVVLEKGVEAALSSLWSVDDMSTSALMADFYQRWAGSDGAVSKAEALRQAELDLLHGNAMPQPGAGGRGVHAVENGPAKQAAPAGLALPYYWAPFVLTGNWQ